MRTVWKYKLGEVTDLSLPADAVVLRVGAQGGHMHAWVDLDPNANQTPRRFVITGTGHEVQPSAKYVGGCSEGPFEWHVWEVSRG